MHSIVKLQFKSSISYIYAHILQKNYFHQLREIIEINNKAKNK